MGQPLYEGLAADLRERVISGILAPGQRLPSEADLVAEHRMSRNAVRNALSLLAREGLIISGQGRGWYVRERNPIVLRLSRAETNVRTDIVPNDWWAVDVREQGREPTQVLGLEVMVAEPDIARRLLLGPDGQVWVRRRRCFVDGEFFMTMDSFYPRELVEGSKIAQPANIVPGVHAVMEELGMTLEDREDEIYMRSATAAEAERFGVQPGDPVGRIYRTRFAADRHPVSVTLTTVPGDWVILVV